jgi:hypothetical protein
VWIKLDVSNLKDISLSQGAIRFFLGGLITAASGVIAQKFGPAAGGLFLAFPAIFPASATLVENTQRTRKERINMNGERRGRYVAAIDARSSALGSMALLAFAIQIWLAIGRYPVWIILLIALVTWMATALAVLVGWRWWRHGKSAPRILNLEHNRLK